jgi:hypothetical protein
LTYAGERYAPSMNTGELFWAVSFSVLLTLELGCGGSSPESTTTPVYVPDETNEENIRMTAASPSRPARAAPAAAPKPSEQPEQPAVAASVPAEQPEPDAEPDETSAEEEEPAAKPSKAKKSAKSKKGKRSKKSKKRRK